MGAIPRDAPRTAGASGVGGRNRVDGVVFCKSEGGTTVGNIWRLIIDGDGDGGRITAS